MRKNGKSRAAMEAARTAIPGGVNSPVRAFKSVGGDPVVMARAEGARVIDVDGNEYIDYVGSWGPMILGHAHPDVIAAVTAVAERGTSFGAPTEAETRLAKLVIDRVPGVDRVRLVNSGTEATMSAVRLARAHTGRDKLIKFAGCYHGHADAFLVSAGSGAATLGVPDSPGVPRSVLGDTLVAPYNDLERVRELFGHHTGDIAAVIVEPVAGNMGCIPPEAGFLEGLREVCTEHGAVLIFDEVMTGFRVARGGAIERFGVDPDLVTLGKVIGGGLPVGAYAGPARLMDQISPAGPVYQAGTLSGNPLATAAGVATLTRLDEAAYEHLEAMGARLQTRLDAVIADGDYPVCTQRVGAMFGLFFRRGPVRNFEDAQGADTARFGRFFHAMLDRGVYLAPSAFEAGFLSTAHDEKLIDTTVEAARDALAEVFGA